MSNGSIQVDVKLASEVIDGANAWDLQPQDRARVAAFMRGLNRTAMLKFDHPGLEVGFGHARSYSSSPQPSA